MNVIIEVHVESQICYALKVSITDVRGTLQQRAELRQQKIDIVIRYLQKGIMQFFNKPTMQCFIVIQSKINNDEKSSIHS